MIYVGIDNGLSGGKMITEKELKEMDKESEQLDKESREVIEESKRLWN